MLRTHLLQGALAKRSWRNELSGKAWQSLSWGCFAIKESCATVVMFVILAFVFCCVEARQPKLNLLQSLTKPSKAWTGCYELICCKARWRSVLEETNCLAKPSRAWAGDVFPSKNHVPLLWLLLLSRECDSRFRFLLRGGIFFCFRATISRHKYK